MTLTRILPTLRRSIPDPINHDLWPELTRATTTDVVVAGVSLLRVVDLCGTPCVHSAAAVLPGTRGIPSDTERTTAIVVRIASVERDASGTLRIVIDAALGDVRPSLSETRLIARASTARVASAVLVEKGWPDERAEQQPETDVLADRGSTQPREWPLAQGLPADLAEGDLLAIPCRGSVMLSDVRPLTAPDHVPASAEWMPGWRAGEQRGARLTPGGTWLALLE